MMEPKNMKKKSTTFQNDFTEPEFAAVSLAANHPSTSKRLKVYVADTCKQLMQRPTNTECDKFAYNTSNNKTSILDLNDDCLLHIFSYLNPVERFKFAATCQQVGNIALHQIKVKAEFDFKDMPSNFTLMETRTIVSQIGPYMKKIRLTIECDNYNDYLEFLPIYCQNLVELEFEVLRNIHFETWQRMFLSAKNLKSLKLSGCNIDDRICSLFVHLTQLECLDLSKSPALRGEHLSKLKNIIDLNLQCCQHLGLKYFIEMCKSMQLKALNISSCFQLNDASFEYLVETQPNLERITVNSSYNASNVSVIGKLNSLKHIRILCNDDDEENIVKSEYIRIYCNDDGDLEKIVKSVAEHRKDDLESLTICDVLSVSPHFNRERILEFKNLKKLSLVHCYCLDSAFLLEISRNYKQLEDLNIACSYQVGEDEVVGAVKNLIHLRRLDISYCKQFKDNLYHRIVEVLRERKSTNLLTLCVFWTGIKQSLAKKNEDIVALSFDDETGFIMFF